MSQSNNDAFIALYAETAPDLAAVRAEVAVPDASDDAVEAILERAPDLQKRLDLNEIAGAALVVFERTGNHWVVTDEISLLQPQVSEEDILEAVVTTLSKHPNARLVTFDGAVHEVPVLQVRAMLHRLGGTGCNLTAKFDATAKHLDLRQALTPTGGDGLPSLEDFADRFGLPYLESHRFGLQSELVTDEEFALGKAYLVSVLYFKYLYLGAGFQAPALTRTLWELAAHLRRKADPVAHRIAEAL